MVSALQRKLSRQLWNYKALLTALLVIAALGTLVISGLYAYYKHLDAQVSTVYREGNMGNWWLTADQITSDDLNYVRTLPGVLAAERRLTGEIKIEGQRAQFIITDGVSRISMPIGAESQGLLIDRRFAAKNHWEPGQELTLALGSIEERLELKGTVLHPEGVFLAAEGLNTDMGLAVFPAQLLDRPVYFNQIVFELAENTPLQELRSVLEAYFGERLILQYGRDDHPSAAVIDAEVEQAESLIYIFPVVFLLVAVLTLVNTLRQLLLRERQNIGTLKALGYNKSRILVHYASFGVIVAICGAILGILAGPPLLLTVMSPMVASLYQLPEVTFSLGFMPKFILAGGFALAALAVAAIECLREMAATPAESMRPKAPRSGKYIVLERIQWLWKRTGMNGRLALRNIFRQKLRAFMVLIGVLGCTALMLTAFGMNYTLNQMTEKEYDQFYGYDLRAELKDGVTPAQIEGLNDVPGVDRVEKVTKTFAVASGKTKENIPVLELEEKNQLAGIDPPAEGVLLTKKTAELLGVEKGDDLKLTLNGETSTETVSDVVGISLFQGAVIKGGQSANQLWIKLDPEAEDNMVEKIKSFPFVNDVYTLAGDKAQVKESLESFSSVIAILVLAAVLLAAVVLFNLGTLNFSERIRDIATLKVLGVFKGEIQKTLLKETMYICLGGILLGLPLGMGIHRLMLATGESNQIWFPKAIGPAPFILTVVLTFLATLLINWVISLKVNKVLMVESLKSIE